LNARRFTGLALAALLACPLGVLAQGITGEVSRCSRPGCDVTARLHLNPDRATASVTSVLFVAIARSEGGQPDLSAGGWYDGRGWKPSSAPVGAWTGRLSRRTANVRIPGGVCGMVQSAGGPPGTYALFAGWGRTGDAGNVDAYSADLDDIQNTIREFEQEGDHEAAAEVRRLLAEYRAALTRLQESNAGENAAFLDARNRGTYWSIASFDCSGNH